ncbi:P-loop containing nucleoside triphosphate hydrolase protein [Pluteus cervinus]|uniref:P-loop containing nucleoside triphosphate hydrolase protein n=1 Tax=Pluteus cervinus TaxID=181527 RepID=A0ACD3AWH0_9AGAR|nr:P-loop containing nucleoside triphosphate hydrolase protein [Pluteus cervinus]
MADKPFTLKQDLYSSVPPPQVTVVHQLHSPLAVRHLDALAKQPVLGLAASLDSQCRVQRLAVASTTDVLYIALSTTSHPATHQVLQKFLGSPTPKAATKMDLLAASLFLDHKCHVSNGIDLLSTIDQPRSSYFAFKALFTEKDLGKSALSNLFRVHDSGSSAKMQGVCLLAWAACRIAVGDPSPLASVPKISTSLLNASELQGIARSIQVAHRLVKMKPHFTRHEVEANTSSNSKVLRVRCTRFKTRIRNSSNSIEIAAVSPEGKEKVTKGKVNRVQGRNVNLLVKQDIKAEDIRSVKTIGRDDPTVAEIVTESLLLSALQGRVELFVSPFPRALWTPERDVSWKSVLPLPKTTFLFPSPYPLNSSQSRAVRAIIHPTAHRIALIHGPPGTGKTTVIAAAVSSLMSNRKKSIAVCLIAQSNVAVKNIAERLIKSNFSNFKILVSHDFHFDWHEHLYEKLSGNVIRSDQFNGPDGTLSGAKVVLSPPNVIIFDEASQINVADYFPLLQQFQGSLRKLVFIGDDKQLPPYGSEEIQALESIFQFEHLQSNSLFLDTQCQMPVPIGEFISEHIYAYKLKTEHQITKFSSCKFIDVGSGHEQQEDKSWVNLAEAKVVAKLAQKLHRLKRSYRIITPYDAQRSVLENGLRAEKIPWQDRCYNIDSFQGAPFFNVFVAGQQLTTEQVMKMTIS